MRPALAVAIVLPSLLFAAEQTRGVTNWLASWGASPSPPLAEEAQMRAAKFTFENQTLREIVHLSLGGKSLRIRLSNAYGKKTVAIGSVHIALHSQAAGIAAGSDHTVTFSGQPAVSLPPDALVLSDPIRFDVPAAADLAISLFLPQSADAAGIHYAAQQTAYLSSGNQTAAASLPDAATLPSWVFLTGVDVLAGPHASTLVAFGDSITDGAHSSVDANRRWPNILFDRFRAAHPSKPIAVLDSGIGGNRILHDPIGNVRFGVNALARFDRDVLAQPGVKYIIVLEGINDLGHAGTSAPASEAVTAQDLIAGLTQLIERAHEKGLLIFVGTLTPFEGTTFPGYFTPEKELHRKALNAWIRTSHAFDGVIDFDKAVQDPHHPDRMLAAYDSGDHLHPNDAGYQAMGNCIDPSLFR